MNDFEKRLERIREAQENATWIQGVGAHKGKPARDVEPGDEMVFNTGVTNEILEIVDETEKTVVFKLESDRDYGSFTRRKKKDTIVPIDGMGVYNGIRKDELQGSVF